MPRQTTEEARWHAAIVDFRRSGLTQSEFCQRRGLPLHTFRRRLYARPAPEADLPATAAGPPDAPRFLPVTLVPERSIPTPSATSDPLVLILDGGTRLAVAPGFDPETLRRLLDVLGVRP